MKVLVLGGTGFVGRHLVEELLKLKHTVTLFNRGVSGPDLFPQCESIVGDRSVSHANLAGRTFDIAVDTNGRSPRIVADAAKILDANVKFYAFISSISAYDDLEGSRAKTEITENSALLPLAAADYDSTDLRTYGARKAECERILMASIGRERLLITRPGLIVGPHDPTDRFTYWPVRCAEGGKMLCPFTGESRFIDVRDYAQWLAMMLTAGESGIFNVVCPPIAFRTLIETCAATVAANERGPVEIVWAEEDFLAVNNVRPWVDIPAWAPGMRAIAADRALRHGLTISPLADTIRATATWAKATGKRRPLLAGLTAEREDEILTAEARSTRS